MLVEILHDGNYAQDGLINVVTRKRGDIADLGNDDYANGLIEAGLAKRHEPIVELVEPSLGVEPEPKHEPKVIEPSKPSRNRKGK